MKSPSRSSSIRTTILTVTVALVGFSLTAMTVFFIADRENKRSAAEFDRRVEYSQGLLQNRSDNMAEVFHTLRKFFRTKKAINAADFRALAEHERNCQPGLCLLAWVPAVTMSECEELIRRIRAEGIAGFDITDPDPAQFGASLTGQTNRLPICYLAGERNTIGFELGLDLGRIPAARALLDKAHESEWLAFSEPFIPTTHPHNDRHVMIAAPAYWEQPDIPAGDNNPKLFRGFFFGVVRVAGFVGARFDRFRSTGLDFLILDKSAMPGNEVVFFYDSSLAASNQVTSGFPTEADIHAGEHRDAKIALGYQSWDLLIRPSRKWIRTESLATRVVWGIGLLCTALTAFHIHLQSRRTRVVEGIVQERTAALIQTQTQLKNELQRLMEYQAQIKESESNLSRAQSIAGLGIWKWDWTTERLTASDQFWKLYHREPDGTPSSIEKFIQWSPPEDRERLRELKDRARKGESVPPFEFRVVWPDETVRIIRGIADFARDSTGNKTGVICTYQDITETKQIELELRRQREEYQMIFNLVPALIMYKDVHGRVLKLNRAGADIIGRPIREIEGCTLRELDLQDAALYEQVDRLVISEGRTHLGVIEPLRHASGKQMWLSADKAPHRDPDGRIIGVVVLARDITLLREAENELERRNAELSVLNAFSVELNKSLILKQVLNSLQNRLDKDLGIAAGSIATYNSDAKGELTFNAVWGNTETPEGYWRDFRQHESAESGVQIHAQDGEGAADIQRLRIPLLAQGDTIGFIEGVTRAAESDHSFSPDFFQTLGMTAGVALQHARLFEEMLESRERLRDLSRQLVSVQETEQRHIARELHDHVGQLLSALKMALEAEGYFPQKSQAAAILDDLIRRVRHISLNLRPTALDDLGLVPAILGLIEQYPASNPEIRFEHTGSERRFPPQTEMVAFRVVQEGLTNALRHARAAHITVRIWADEHQLAVQVEDDGSGFDSDEALQSHSSTGLPGMRERVHLAGGEFIVESSVGQGARIIAELPLQEPATRNS